MCTDRPLPLSASQRRSVRANLRVGFPQPQTGARIPNSWKRGFQGPFRSSWKREFSVKKSLFLCKRENRGNGDFCLFQMLFWIPKPSFQKMGIRAPVSNRATLQMSVGISALKNIFSPPTLATDIPPGVSPPAPMPNPRITPSPEPLPLHSIKKTDTSPPTCSDASFLPSNSQKIRIYPKRPPSNAWKGDAARMPTEELHVFLNSVQQMVSGELAGEGLQTGFSRHGLPFQRALLDTVYPLREHLNSVQRMASGGYCEGLFPDTVCWTRLRNAWELNLEESGNSLTGPTLFTELPFPWKCSQTLAVTECDPPLSVKSISLH